MSRRSHAALLASLCLVVAAGTSARAAAQTTSGGAVATPSALRVFLDCATWRCREDRFRQEIAWVDWVREPQDAQVYVLMTGQQAGSGGFRYTLDFEGRGSLAELSDRYEHTSSATDVEEEVVAGLSRTLAAGLVRFAARGGFADMLRVMGTARAERAPQEVPGETREDPWDFWVFSLRGNAEVEREDRESQDRFNFGASANRTTEAWKIDVGGNLNLSRREVEFDDGDTFLDERDDWGSRLLVVRSLGPHWSAGFMASSGSSTRFNRDFAFEFSPAVEWNFFPWQESTRRRLVALYTVGLDYLRYDEITVYEKLEETLLQQRMDVQFRVQEPWGNASFGAEARQYLRYLDQYSVELDANLDYRLLRGFGVDLGARYEVVHDQRYLSGAGLTPEEILTSRRALATGSRFSFEVGLNYRFGSIFNNVVNARFPGLGGR